MSQFETLSDIKSEATYHNYDPVISFTAEPYSGEVLKVPVGFCPISIISGPLPS